MKVSTIVEYEQSDFDAVRDGMTSKEAVEILASLPRGWFPYRLPVWGGNVGTSDYDNYRTCCAIDMAIQALTEVNDSDQP